MTNKVKRFFKDYIESILKNKKPRINIMATPELKERNKETAFKLIVSNIENYPDNLIYYLSTDDIDEELRQKIVNYFIREEVNDLLEELLIRPDMWADLNKTLKNVFGLDDLIKISVAMQSDLELVHEEEEIRTGSVRTFLNDCLNGSYAATLQITKEFYTLAQKWASYADSYKVSVSNDIRASMSKEDIRKIEEKIMNGATDLETIHLLVGLQDNLSRDFIKYLATNYLEIIPKIGENHFKVHGLYTTIQKITAEFSAADIINFCDKIKASSKLDSLLNTGVYVYLGEKTNKFIFTYLHDEIINYFSKDINFLLSDKMNYYVCLLNTDDIKKIFGKLKSQIGLDELKKYQFSTFLTSNQLDALYELLKDDFEKAAHLAIHNGTFTNFIKTTDSSLVKKMIPNVLSDLIKTSLTTGDISFFYNDEANLFNNAQIRAIAISLKDLFIQEDAYYRIWKEIRKCYSKNDSIKAINTFLSKNDYYEAYILAKTDKLGDVIIHNIYERLVIGLEENAKVIKDIPEDMLRKMPIDLAVRLADSLINWDYSLARLMPLSNSQIVKIRDNVMAHYHEYSVDKVFKYAKLISFTWKMEERFLNYVIDLWYENYFPNFDALEGPTNFSLEKIARRAQWHREILLRYLLDSDTVKTHEIVTLIKGDKLLKSFYELPDNKLFKLYGYELTGIDDYFKLCKLYKESKLSLKAFCGTYHIYPSSGFDKFLKILGSINASELEEIANTKAIAANSFYQGMMSTAKNIINDKISMSEYFETGIGKFKNQKASSIIDGLRTKDEKNNFVLKFIDYVVEKQNSYLPYSVIEFLNNGMLKPDEVFQEYFKCNLILPKDKKYYSKYHVALKTVLLNMKHYVRRALYMEFVIDDVRYKVDDDTIDMAYTYLKKNHYCISEASMLKATREVAMGKIQVEQETKEYKEQLASEIVDTIKECLSLEDYILKCKEDNLKLSKGIVNNQ